MPEGLREPGLPRVPGGTCRDHSGGRGADPLAAVDQRRRRGDRVDGMHVVEPLDDGDEIGRFERIAEERAQVLNLRVDLGENLHA